MPTPRTFSQSTTIECSDVPSARSAPNLQPFGAAYADHYDAIYHDKDYAAECDLIQRALAECATPPVRSILDLGCGTGRHAELLANRGYFVVGVDRSKPMIDLALARSVAICGSSAPEYHVADLRAFRIDRRFDAATMMFAVLGYQIEDDDVLAALRTARRHLREGGVLLFDCWYGPAVLRQQPSTRAKKFNTLEGPIVRTSRSELNEDRRCISVSFHLRRADSSGENDVDEVHVMRYFFADELERFLSDSGFRLIRIGAMPDFEKGADETTWNVFVAAAAV